jgi:uncharacterized lipoprotein YehR (DUF1307 family)
MATFVLILMIAYFGVKLTYEYKKLQRMKQITKNHIKSFDLKAETVKGAKVSITKEAGEDFVNFHFTTSDGQTINVPNND